MAWSRKKKPNPRPLPKDVAETLDQAKDSRERLARELDQNAIVEQVRRAIKGEP